MLGNTLTHDAYLQRLKSEIDRVDRQELQHWADLIYSAWQDERFVFIFGNGGCGHHGQPHDRRFWQKPAQVRGPQRREQKTV